jgi:SAM-dependent methyltransferase
MAATVQDDGDHPIAARETDDDVHASVSSFVQKWDELIGWTARAACEGAFVIDLLKARGARTVLDVATGTGFHSVRLQQAGFDVTSADGSPEMLAKAFENARHVGQQLTTVQADWRWLNKDIHDTYDAVICLGNGLAHLFSERDRRKALAEFYAALRHDGCLIVDQRNYDVLLDEGFRSKRTYHYCGDSVRAEPEHIDEGLARFAYVFPDKSKVHLNLFPLRRAYVRRLMAEVGFQDVKTFGQFQETSPTEAPDFFVHVATKDYSDSYLDPARAGVGDDHGRITRGAGKTP